MYSNMEKNVVETIKINKENCTGCRICQMICSLTHFNKISLKDALIQIDNPYDLTFEIKFLENCLKCYLCVDYCLYNALERIEEEG